MRFKAKPHMQADASHVISYQADRHYWCSYNDIPQMMEPEVNQFQVSKLGSKVAQNLYSLTRDVCERLGYARYVR